MNVLIVEDEAITAMVLQQTLTRQGYSVIAITASGEDACRLAASGKPDVIIMDIGLAGGMDGIAAASRIREDTDTPIIFSSGYNTTDMKRRTAAVPNSVFLPKPVNPEAFHSLLQKITSGAPR